MNNRPLSKEYIGKRLLISDYSVSCSDPTEAGILEVSPSGEYAKVQIKKVDNTTYTKWCHVTDYVVLEELESVMDQISDVVEKFNKDLRETERKAREEFSKHSSPKKPLYQTGDFFEHEPKTICASDHYTITDKYPKSFAMHSEVKKQNWVHGICNPPADDAKKYVKECKSTGRRYNSVDELIRNEMRK
jgi:hypothetical protein